MNSYGRPAVVIDNGTGYTKMGFAGNVEPQYIVPTVTAFKATQVSREKFPSFLSHVKGFGVHISVRFLLLLSVARGIGGSLKREVSAEREEEGTNTEWCLVVSSLCPLRY